MRSILVINDHSSAANCAAKFALSIAQKVGANLVLLNAVIPVNILPDMEYEFVPENGQADYLPLPEAPLTEQLTMQNQCYEKFRPEITVSSHDLFFSEQPMPLVQQQGIWMVVKGFPGAVISPRQDQANTRAILNKVQCPVLLVPETKRTTGFGHIVHTTDLRYCKLRNLNFLVELAKPYQASLLLAHICMSGLPPMEKTYAFEFFNKEISSHIRYPKLLFEQIREKKLEKVYDVLTYGMNTDLLAVVNHQFNFEDLVIHDESDKISATLTVPLLVFPY